MSEHDMPRQRSDGVLRRSVRALVRALEAIEYGAAGVVLVVLIVTTFLGVVMRYAFDSPFTWMEEIQLASMVWIAFLAAPIAFRHRGHVAVEIVVDSLPRPIRRYVEMLVAVVVYTCLAYFLARSLAYLQTFATTGRSTPILRIPYTVVYGIAPVSALLMAISYTKADVLVRFGRSPAPSSAEVGT